MNGGPPNPTAPGQEVWLPEGSVVTPEDYRRNQQLFTQWRDQLARMEQRNEQAHRRYTMMEQELENRVAQGREAERLLAQVRSRPQAQLALPAPSLLAAANHAPNGTSSNYAPSQTYSAASGPHTSSGNNGEFVQGNSRTTSGTAQAYNYYDPSSAQYTQPPPPPNIQHQPNQQQQAYSVPYWHTANQQPYGATNYSHYDASRHPSQQYQTNYPQGYSATAAPAGPPSASTSRVDEVSRAGSSQAASSAGWPAGHSSAESSKQASRPVSDVPTTVQTQDTRKVTSEELQKRAAVAAERIHGIVQTLPHQTVLLMFRLVVNKLKHKMTKADGSPAPIPNIENLRNSITPQIDHLANLIVTELQNLSAPLILATLHKVQERLTRKANTAATGPPAVNSTQQPTFAVNTQPTQNAASAAPPAPLQSQAQPSQPVTIRPPQVNWPGFEKPSHRPQTPREEDSQEQQQPPDGAATPEVPERSIPDSAPSVSFSNLPSTTPQTPQNGAVRPTFTPGRLAHDILRSLGKPTGHAPPNIFPPASASQQASQDGTQMNGKRKRSVSPVESNDKRQKSGANLSTDPLVPEISDDVQPATASTPVDSVDVSKAVEALIPPEQPASTQDDSMTVVEEPEEIHTPGVIQSVLNEAVAALQRSHTTHLRDAHSPMHDAPPAQDGIISSPPEAPSAASLPPSSKVSTPEPEVDVEMAAPVTPVAGPSKRQPLFFVSPSASPDEEHPGAGFDDAMSEFVPSGLLAGSAPPSARKGKERARADEDTDSDVVVVETSEPEEAVGSPRTTRKAPAGAGLPRAYVLVPPPSKELEKLWREYGSQKPRAGARIVGRAVVSSDEDSDVDEIAEDFRDEATQMKEAAEARVVQDLCYTRLKACQCRWSNCTAVLESAKKLGVHARTHVFDFGDDSDVYACSWEGCPREYRSKERLAHHVQKHSLHPVTCAYAGCDFECWAARDMVMHHKQPKHRGQALKPEAGPVKPDLDVALPPLPQTLPSYMSISRPVRAARMSEERHAKLTPRIAANLSTWTPLGEASDATSLRTPRRPKLSEKLVASLESGEVRNGAVAGQAAQGPVRGAYDYWLEPRRRVRRLCDDIPSRAVTDMFAKGLVIDDDWLARGDPGWEFHEQDADGDTDDELPAIQEPAGQPEEADGGAEGVGRADDGVSAVAAEAEELHAPRTLADGPTQQPGWEVLPDANEEAE